MILLYSTVDILSKHISNVSMDKELAVAEQGLKQVASAERGELLTTLYTVSAYEFYLQCSYSC